MSATEYYQPLAATLLVLLAAGTASIFVYYTRFFGTLVESNQQRLSSLDGLRGFLAFFVFIHHLTIFRVLVVDGVWTEPKNALFSFFGSGSVSLFFMASGFLFWSRAIERKIVATRLYVSRFWRIMPLYWVTMACVVLFAALAPNAQSFSSLGRDTLALLRWFTGGAFGDPALFNVDTTSLNAGVTWSLQYEWWFYVTLPFIASLATPKRFAILLVTFVVSCLLTRQLIPVLARPIVGCWGFFAGMLAAHLSRIGELRDVLRRTWVGVASIILLVGAFVTFQVLDRNHVPGLVAFPLFLAIACGNTLGGALSTRWSQFLGHTSYSIYLVHGLVLHFVFQCLLTKEFIAALSPVEFWFVAQPVAIVVVVISALTYRFVEAPFLGRASLSAKTEQKYPKSKVTTANGSRMSSIERPPVAPVL